MSARRFVKLLNRFLSHQGGSVAMIFAVASVPMLAAAGVAVDFARTLNTRTEMQTNLDATALMLAKEAEKLGPSALSGRARQDFAQRYHRDDVTDVVISVEYDPQQDGKLKLHGTAKLKAGLAGVFGIRSFDVDVTTEVTWGYGGRLDLAVVLDNTGSMASNGKISALINASHELLNTLESSGSKTVKVAIVPFDTQVKIGKTYVNEGWLDWSAFDDTSVYGDGGDGDNDNDDEYDGNAGTIDHSKWTGCVVDRTMPLDVSNSAPTANAATWHPASNCTLAPVIPLTNDWAALHATVGQMKAVGMTNLNIGLVWGWDMLTVGVPLSTAVPPEKGTKRYMIFLTDGNNTQNRFSTNSATIDARTRQVCKNIKDDGVILYTVRVVNGNEALLRECASDPTMYFDVEYSSQLSGVFQQITKGLERTLALSR